MGEMAANMYTKGLSWKIKRNTKARIVTTKALGVVLVDHGSKKKEANAMLDAFAHIYQRKTGRQLVEVAHMEIAEPSIATAIDKCIERGADDIVVAPYFLSPGRHIQKDIPALVKAAALNNPDVSIKIADPIGSLYLFRCQSLCFH